MIKALIIDDEKHCIITLQFLLDQLENVEVVDAIQDSRLALKAVEELKPDLVFLDIEMPHLNGFDFLGQFAPPLPFKVVFTTAYDQYAIRALKLNALDYLMKPIDKQDLLMALEKFEHGLQVTGEQVQNLHVFNSGVMQDTIGLSTQNGLLFVKIEDIMYLEASSCYTYLMMRDQTRHLASKTMATFEDVLQDNPLFFRAHKSHIVNLKFIKQYIRGEGGDLILQDGKSIPLSRNRKQDFLQLFKKV
jgi:two-component system, LytTR family, response regulator